MSNLGLTDLKTVLRVPDTIDLTYLKQFNGKEGTKVDFPTLVRNLGTAALLFNNQLLTGYWSKYLLVSTDLETLDDTGGAGSGLKKYAEYTRNPPVSADDTAHMIPMDDYGRDLTWTYWAIRRGTNDRLLRQIRLFIDDSNITWEKAILTRAFKSTYDSVGTGKSTPFADGGTADTNYIPPSYDGYTFDNTHTHYLRYADTSAGRDAYLAAAGLHMRHHGILGPYDLVISEGDIADWVALKGADTSGGATAAKWIKPKNGLLDTTNVEVRGQFESGDYVGVIETDRDTFLVKTTNRVSTDHCGVFKPMGLNNPFNPFRIRYEQGYPLGITIIQEQPGVWPLQGAAGIFTFGVGINNRLNGVLGYFAASGAYVDPTIS